MFLCFAAGVGDRGARDAARRPRRQHGALRLHLAPVGQADRVRGRLELEVHRRELQRVLPLPGRPSPAQQAHALRPRRRLRPQRRLAGRLDGARRGRRDDGARRRPRLTRRPAADVRDHDRPTSSGSTTTSCGRRRSCRSTRTTCSSTGWCRVDAGHTQVICDWLFEGETIDAEGFDPSERDRVLGPHQPPGLARVRAPAARDGVAELGRRPLLEPARRRCRRST